MIDNTERDDDWRTVLAEPLHHETFQPSSSAIEMEVAAASDCGKVQPHNTDHFLVVRLGRSQETLLTSLSTSDLPPRFKESGYAMLVADGLGEDGAGGHASRVAVSALAHLAIRYGKWNVRIGPGTANEIRDQAAFFYREAHEAVVQASQQDLRLAGMATSLTAVYIAGTDLFYAHAGHSRAFVFRNGVLIQLTTDHTLEQQRDNAPILRVLERSHLDQKHIVTTSIGGRPGGPDIEIEHVQLWSGDRVLLCTNGLTDVVSDDQIADVLAQRRQPDEDCRRLIALALDAGGPDNVTVLAADYRVRAIS